MTATRGTLAELDGGECKLPSSLWALFMEGLGKNPNHRAVTAMHQDPHRLDSLVGLPSGDQPKHLTLTYAQLRLGSAKLASSLRANGFERGSALVTIIPNCVEWCLYFLASMLLEATFIPLDVRIVEPARKEDLRYYLETLNPKAIVVKDSNSVDVVNKMMDELNMYLKVGVCLDLDHTLSKPWSTMTEIASATPAVAEECTSAPESVNAHHTAIIIYTSGTSTGIPKGCPHTVQSLLNGNINHSMSLTIDSGGSTIIHTANFRAIMVVLTLLTLHNGGTLIMPSATFSPATTLDAIEEYQVTAVMCVPSMVYAIAGDPSYSIERVRSLRQVSISGDVTTVAIVRLAQSVFPDSRVKALFGMTEGSGVLAWPIDARIDSVPAYQGIISVGKIMPGSKVRIVDANGNVMRRGETGELHLSSLSAIRQYTGEVKPELFYRRDFLSWFITGDRAMIDQDSWVYVLGRSKDIIKRGGVPIAPAGIEACISEHFQVQTVAIDVPHPVLGQELFAIIDPRSSVPEASIKQLIVDRLGLEYALGGVFTLKQLGLTSWPLNSSGKVAKNELRAATVVLLPNQSVML